MHMVAARLGFEKAMVGTRWATPHPDCMDRLRKHDTHLAEGWYLARKAAWSLSQDAHINCENGQLGCLYSCGISYSLDIILLCYLSLIAISKMLHETSYFLSFQAFPG